MLTKRTKGKEPKKPLDIRQQLIYDLIFLDKTKYELEISLYVDQYSRTAFLECVRDAVLRGGRSFVEDRVIHRDEGTIWRIELAK